MEDDILCKQKLQDRHHTLELNPRIASYARVLEIFVDQATIWALDDSHFHAILDIIAEAARVRNECSLEIKITADESESVSIPAHLAQNVFACVGPFVRSLSVSFFEYVPLSWIILCPNLFRLDFNCVVTLQKAGLQADGALGSQLPQPHELYFNWIEDCPEEAEVLTKSLIDPSQLRVISSKLYDQSGFVGLRRIIDTCNRTLEELHFFCGMSPCWLQGLDH